MASVDEKWKKFISVKKEIVKEETIDKLDTSHIQFSIHISTKTKTLYFNKAIDIHKIFWNIPIVEYSTLTEGIIKKEIKIVNNSIEENTIFEENLGKITSYYNDYLIKDVDNPNSRKTKYKNEHKLIVGLNKKDIIKKTSKYTKQLETLRESGTKQLKGAFRNCLVIIIRLLEGDEYKETHVKIFNTGIIKIPGILNIESFEKIKMTIYDIINKFESVGDPKLCILEDEYCKVDLERNVLINSNFKCGFNIYLDKLYKILRSQKYNIEVSMDTTTYPALRCKFYYHTETGYDIIRQKGVIHNDDLTMKWKDLNKSGKYRKISVMIFRTGNGLIMGKISEKLLMFIFDKLKQILIDEYDVIYNPAPFIEKINKVKREKQIKINIIQTVESTVG